MKTIQIVLDESLLKQTDREVRRSKTNRSELFREAMRALLRQRRVAEAEARERRGYTAHPADEFDIWDKVQSWPED